VANESVPGPKGTDVLDDPPKLDPFPATAGGALPTPGGIELKAGDRTITKVKRDWDPSNPRATPGIQVHGKTLLEVGKALMALPGEWGQGGGILKNDPVPAGDSAEVEVTLHGNLIFRIAEWVEYASASAKGKANWDAMIAKLKVHEQKHLDNAVEAAEQCANDLIGKEVLQMPGIVTKANAALQAVQDALDGATDHGAKANVPFGDVILDTNES
jgi:hypothetical protein